MCDCRTDINCPAGGGWRSGQWTLTYLVVQSDILTEKGKKLSILSLA